MGNESQKLEEKDQKNQEQIQKDEIPPDTQPNNQNIENATNSENQIPNQIIIKEKHYESNEDGINTKEDERRVEYRILKVNKENDENENAEIGENIDYDENAEQGEENVEEEYEINQQEQEGGLGNEQYFNENENENIYEKENLNQNINQNINQNQNYQGEEKYSKIHINKSCSNSQNQNQTQFINKYIQIIN